MTRNWWIWSLLLLMVMALALGSLVNFTSAFLALPVLAVVLATGLLLRVLGARTTTYEPPEEARATGRRLPRSPQSDA